MEKKKILSLMLKAVWMYLNAKKPQTPQTHAIF